MSCSNCGRQNPPTALYCLDCGQKLRDAGAPVAAPAAAPMAAPPQSAPIPDTAHHKMPPPQAVESCPRCHVDNPPGMRFCRMCGSPMASAAPAAAAAPAPPRTPSQCPRCRSALDQGASFCGVCGMSATDMFQMVNHVAGAPAMAPAVAAAQPFAAPPNSPFGAGGPFGGAPMAAAQPAGSPAPSGPFAAAPPAAAPAPAAAMQIPAAAPASLAQPPRPELRTDNYGGEAGVATARLVTILKDGSEGPQYKISGTSTDIGRAEGNILLQDDPYLSPRHARISVRNGHFYLRDLGSVNGVFYRLREPIALHNGDVVLAGQQVLRLEILGDGELSLGPVMHYGVMLFGTPELARFARLVQLTTEGVPRDVFHLHREETVIGREQGDIVFTDDAFMSRRHASFKIDRAQKRVTLRDLGSSNGTLVQFRGEREINDGDLFRIGHHLFRFDTGARANGGPVGR
jgi:pSer/pThr/pTyr-binding forkhead associated (FHA) protein